MENKSVAAQIPIKSHSERLANKNFREFNGRPLYHWIIKTLENVDQIDQIYIDTDAVQVIENAPKLFDVEIIERPDELRGQRVSMNDILMHDISSINADIYLHTHCTNPLLKPSSIDDALTQYKIDEQHDSLFSVTRHQMRAFDAEGEAINHKKQKTERTQDVSPIYEENANIYIFSHEGFIDCESRIGDNPMMYELDQIESTEIDVHSDFQIAEYFHRKRAVTSMIEDYQHDLPASQDS